MIMHSVVRSLATRVARSSHRVALVSNGSVTSRHTLSALVTTAEWAASLPSLHTRGFAKAANKSGKSKSTGGNKPTAATGAAAASEGNEMEAAAALLDKTKKNMTGAVLQFTRALAQMRPGKADAGMLDELHVQAYGAHVALSQVAQVAVVSSHAVSVNVYDPSLLQEIKKAVETMNPVFSVREDTNALHVSFPKMSKETRAELIKAAKKQAEQSRQHVRRVRQDAMNSAKKFKEHMSEDDVKKHQDEVQTLTDEAVAEIGKLLAAKEKDLVEV